MIQAKELRINNIVWMISKQKEYVIDRGQDIDNSEDFNPIPLTEEWLLKFGFEETEFCFEIGSFFLTKGLGCSTGKFLYQAHKYRFSVKSVHQLMNLYFAITNKELNYESRN